MPLFYRITLIVLTLALAVCTRRPQCDKFSITAGERRGFSSFNHPNDTAAWSACSDGKTRTLRCTTGHWSNWKCVCSIDGVEKIKSRSEKPFPEERAAATAFANKMCGWNIQ